MNKYIYIPILFVLCVGVNIGCRKQLQINPPYNSISTSEVFADSADAASALSGLYSVLINTGPSLGFGSGAATEFLGLSSDELISFDQGDAALMEFYNNTLEATNSYIQITFWPPLYSMIYQTNALIEGVNSSTGIKSDVKNRITGQAKFFRAYFYFYLTNLFGDVPLITATDYKSSSLKARTPAADVYRQIVQDLQDAQNLLPDDYSDGQGERIQANKSAATALLARVNLYMGQWSDAIAQASTVINSSQFKLVPDLNGVFLRNSTEAILQLQINSSIATGVYNATPEGFQFIPIADNPPLIYIDSDLLNSFETGDQRKVDWLDSTVYSGTVYYYPYKYKIGSEAAIPNGPTGEYYMVLRLAEQYLIRAEARAQQNTDLDGAISDLNMVRNRAGLESLHSLNQTQILKAIAQERRIEFFSEWGHRWLDLKRTGQANSVLSKTKPLWQSYQELYPVPGSDLVSDPNMSQNSGY